MSYKEEFVWDVATSGYWSELGGVEVKGIEQEEMDDYCYCLSDTFTGTPTKHRLKIKYTTGGDAYITLNSHRLYFRDCIRVGYN